MIVTQTLRPTIGVSAPDEDQLAIEVGARGKKCRCMGTGVRALISCPSKEKCEALLEVTLKENPGARGFLRAPDKEDGPHPFVIVPNPR